MTYKRLKIISGYLKGQIINTIQSKNLRPTISIIRETLFNWMSKKVKNSECLDCFSGSGILSFESISRYAKYVTLLEINKKIMTNIQKNIIRLKINNIKTIYTNTLIWMKKNTKKYDIIFLDPPYYSNILQKVIMLIDTNNVIKENGYVYIEKPKNKIIYTPNHWILIKKKCQNTIHYALYYNFSKKVNII